MKKKNIIFGLLLLLFIVVSGCDTGDGNGNGNNGGNQGFLALARMDIEDANNLFIAPTPETSKDELYKITDNSEVEKVIYYDENATKLSLNSAPNAIYNAGNNYVIVCYSNNERFLVRKNDGAVFSLKNIRAPDKSGQIYNCRNSKVVQTDANGNIYFYGGGDSIIKIDVSNPATLTATDLMLVQNLGSLYAYDVDRNGNIIFSADRSGTRIRKGNGGVVNVDSTTGVLWWIDLSGNINRSHITYIIDSNYNVTTQERNGGTTYMPSVRQDTTLVRFSDRILLISVDRIVEVDNPENVIRNPSLSRPSFTILRVFQSDNYYYLYGENSITFQCYLVRINPENDTVTILLQSDQYDIYNITMSGDEAIFNAQRFFDGAIIFGKISSSGNLSIIDTPLNTKITVLERIR